MGGLGSGKGIRPNRHRRKRFTHEFLRLDSFYLPKQLKAIGLNMRSLILEARACPFGGSRTFWRCPHCNGRFRYLYYHSRCLGCRRCFRLAYRSQNETLADRLLRKRDKVRDKMGGGSLGKPARMRWSTYNQLADKETEYDSLATLAFMKSARKFADCTDPSASACLQTRF